MMINGGPAPSLAGQSASFNPLPITLHHLACPTARPPITVPSRVCTTPALVGLQSRCLCALPGRIRRESVQRCRQWYFQAAAPPAHKSCVPATHVPPTSTPQNLVTVLRCGLRIGKSPSGPRPEDPQRRQRTWILPGTPARALAFARILWRLSPRSPWPRPRVCSVYHSTVATTTTTVSRHAPLLTARAIGNTRLIKA